MRLESLPSSMHGAAAPARAAVEATVRTHVCAATLVTLLALAALVLLADVAHAQVAPSEDTTATDAAPASPDAEPIVEYAMEATEPAAVSAATAEAEPKARISGSIQTRATIQGGDGNDRLSTRLGLEWLAGQWSGGFSLELSNDRGDSPLFGRDGVGSLELTERFVAWSSRGPRQVELRLGTARGVTFGEGLILGSPSFDGLQMVANVAAHQRLIVLAGRTESLDPDDLLDDDIGIFPADDVLGNDGQLLGVRHEIVRGTGMIGVNLLHAKAEGAPAAGLGSVDWSFSRGIVDFASEIAVHDGGGYGAYARTSVTPSESWGVTVEARRYERFKSPLDSQPRYEGLSSSDEQDETGGVVRFDFSPAERFSGTVSFDYSQGGDQGPGKSTVRRDTRLALRWALTEATSLAYGFELEDLAKGRDGRVHSLLLTHSFEKMGRLSARFSFDRAGAEPRDSMRVSWRCPLRGKKLTFLMDATLRREEHLTKELQAGISLRLGSSSFLTCRATLADDESESVDITWYRRF